MLRAVPGAERARDRRRRVRLHRRPRSAAGRRHRPSRRRLREVDLARPHRLLDAERRRARLPPAVDPPLRRRGLPPRRLRAAARRFAAVRDLAARDRSARAEEHGALARGRRIHRRPVRHRRLAAAAHAGVALRSVEGPARRDRRVPAREGRGIPACSSRSSARWRTTIRRAGTTGTRRSRTPTATPTSSSSRTCNNVGSVEVNAFQVHSAAVIQKSIREGFGLTVSEALWKGRPTVAGRVGGIVTQIEDGRTRLARRLVGGLRRRVHRGAGRSGGGACARASRQGARAQAVPDAAAPARPARALQPARRPGDGRRARGDRRVSSARRGYVSRRAGQAEADRRREPRPRRVCAVGRRRADHEARRRRARHRVAEPRHATRRDLDRERDERRGSRGRRRARRRGVRRDVRRRLAVPACGSSRTTPRRTTGSTTSSRTRRSGSSSTTCGASPTSPTSTPAFHAAWSDGYVPVNEGFAAAVVGRARARAGGDGVLPRLPPLSRAGSRARAAARAR